MITFKDKEKNQDHRKGGQGKVDKVNSSDVGKSLTQADIATIVAQAVAATQSGQPADSKSKPIHEMLGVDASKMEKAKEKVGEETLDLIMGALGNVMNSATANDEKIVGVLSDLVGDFNAKMDKQTSQLEKISKAKTYDQRLIEVNGLDKVFSEDNRDDLGEYFDEVTRASGGLYDAKEQFNAAVEGNDYTVLAKLAEGFNGFAADKYKSSDGVTGARTTTTKEEYEQNKTLEKGIEAKQDKIAQLMASPNKDLNEIARLNNEIEEDLGKQIAQG